MKIDLTYNDLSTKFEDLNPGDTFADGGIVYMKIARVTGEYSETFNAVRLSTGNLTYFSDCAPVSNVRVVAHTEVV
jgi:hypothetical protein